MTTSDQLPVQLLGDLALSPSPYHAVARAAELLAEAGFSAVSLDKGFPQGPGQHYVVSGGSLVAWCQGATQPQSYCLVGAHTDSPNLRIRSNAEMASGGWAQLGVEVYGGALINSWLDRDLGLAGRVMTASTSRDSTSTGSKINEHLFLDDRPLLRIPQLAIHLDRSIGAKGLKLDPQSHLTPLWATGSDEPGALAAFVATGLDLAADDIISWDLMAFDVQPPAIVGRDNDMLASARIDNLVSTFCGVRALIAAKGSSDPEAQAPVLVLYDHEEVGSTSSVGAAGVFLSSILERISAASGTAAATSGTTAFRVAHLETMARSFLVSADGAHATNPNYVDKHEPNHQVALNEGVVIKRNANQRYATDARTEARFRAACNRVGVPVQTYIHRNDIPCGSTIGPISAAGLGIPTVDVGVPQLAMHSVRELCGTADIGHLFDALVAIWTT